jgi:ribonuclease HI
MDKNMNKTEGNIVAFCDGCSKNNGAANARAGSGFVVYLGTAKVLESKLEAQNLIQKISEGSVEVRQYLKNSNFESNTPATNNTAEWLSLYLCLESISKTTNFDKTDKILVLMDSNLVIEQISGRWAVKQPHLKPFLLACKDLLKIIPVKIDFAHIYREYNKEADSLSNQAIE